jgi:diguanylate cyclase (GGDEF)-like protein/PAS domain S-box-containing protein
MKSWSSGIFGFFFSRAVMAIVSFAIILLLILLPFFKNQLLQMVESQGQTFANSTIAATTSNLYTESYGEVIEYLTKVLKDTDNILFVVVSKNSGEDIVITKDEWHQANGLFKSEFNKIGANRSALHFEANPITGSNSFVYHQNFEIGGAPWGMLTVGMSDDQYQYIKNKYMLIVGLASIVLVVVLLLLFYRSSKKIRVEMSNLSETGLQLQTGNLAARASEDGIGEIGSLSKAINTMAINLLEQTNSTKQLAQIVKQTNDAFILFDSSLNVLFVNDAVMHVTGYPTSYFNDLTMAGFTGLLSLDLKEILHELDWVSAHKQHSPTRDVVIVRNNQEIVDVELRLESIANDQDDDQNFLMVLSNITTRKHLEKELHQLAFYDKLTDLPNRRMFMDHLRQVITYSKNNKKSFALFFMDLDNFKFINDTLGHDAGDEFLVQIGNRLKEVFRESDMVTRLGGDEFTILIEDVKNTAFMDVAKMAEKLVKELATKPIYISGRPLSVSTSLGVAQYPQHGEDSDTLLRNADIAMYSAKKSGKNRYAFFSEEMNATLRHRIEIENDLKHAIESGYEIDFYYQPIINLADDQLVGVEALVRWRHPIKGFISPVDFIPIAEASNLIVELSDYLLKIAFKQAQLWSQLAFVPYLSINISGRQFEKHDFVNQLARALETYKVKASDIQLEFTESIMLDSTKETILKFEELKKMGFKIAIDDFGTGYSSLAYIHKLPIDVIKIDRSFVNGMINNRKTNSIVAAITKLSNVLEIKTIAEGIELAEHAKQLKQLQCDYGQGYLYDKALPIAEFESKYLQTLTNEAFAGANKKVINFS